MMLCTGDFCDKKNTCAKYFMNNNMNEPCEVESFATFGSGKIYTDANGSHVETGETWCGPNGNYKKYENKEEKEEPKKMQEMSCRIKFKQFKTLMNAVKGVTESEKSRFGREVLKFIQLIVTKEAITAVACNGYQLSKYTLTQENEEEFTCFFKPFYFREFQWMEDAYVTITYNKDKELVFIRMPASFGFVNYEFNQPAAKYPAETLKILENAKNDTNNSVALKPGLLNISSKCFDKNKNSYVEVFTPKNALSPVYCRTNFSEEESLEHIILPVRLN